VYFTTSSAEPGDAQLVGTEPAAGADLFDQQVTVVDPQSADELEGRIWILFPDETLDGPTPLPLEVPIGSLIMLDLRASSEQGIDVPIRTQDVTWGLEDETGALQLSDEGEGPPPPEGPIYGTVDTGTVYFSAEVPLLSKQGRWELTVVDPNAGD
jgi:hypothetical protein